MDFNYIIIAVVLLLLIIILVLYGVFFAKINSRGYPYTQDTCPKLWGLDSNGNCVNPRCINDENIVNCNSLAENSGWTTNTPGYIAVNNGVFNPSDSGWSSYKGSKSALCGKKLWSNQYNIDWNGVSTYDAC